MSEYITEEFVIDNDKKAEWALGKIREARNERDRMVSWYQKQIEDIKEQTDFETMNLERMLSDYFKATEAAHKRTKTQESYSLPGGKLMLKKQNPEYKREDSTVIEWLKQNKLGFVKVKEELDWDGLKKSTTVVGGNIVTEDGEIVPGVAVVERPEKFVVEV